MTNLAGVGGGNRPRGASQLKQSALHPFFACTFEPSCNFARCLCAAAAIVRDVSQGTGMCDRSRQVSMSASVTTTETLDGMACGQPELVVSDGSALTANDAVIRQQVGWLPVRHAGPSGAGTGGQGHQRQGPAISATPAARAGLGPARRPATAVRGGPGTGGFLVSADGPCRLWKASLAGGRRGRRGCLGFRKDLATALRSPVQGVRRAKMWVASPGGGNGPSSQYSVARGGGERVDRRAACRGITPVGRGPGRGCRAGT